MIVKQIYNTDHKMQILVDLPESFSKKSPVLIVLDDSIDSNSEKMELMKHAKNDPLFQADINDVTEDFQAIDNEIL